MEKQQAYYKCQKCGRESCIVHLDERCVFCEQDKKECSHDWREQGNEETGKFIGCFNCGEVKRSHFEPCQLEKWKSIKKEFEKGGWHITDIEKCRKFLNQIDSLLSHSTAQLVEKIMGEIKGLEYEEQEIEMAESVLANNRIQYNQALQEAIKIISKYK